MSIRSTVVVVAVKFTIYHETEIQFWERLQELKKQIVRTEFPHADAQDAVTSDIRFPIAG